MASRKCPSRKCGVILIVVGAILFLVSLIFLLIFPEIYTEQFHRSLTLTEGTLLFKLWKDVPLPIYQNVYFFNITNADEFKRGKEKLKVAEVGPYVYKSHFVKEDMNWFVNNTMSYREKRTYIFDEERSVGSQDDTINTLNGPLILASDYIKDLPFPERLVAGMVFRLAGEVLVIKKSVGQLMYDGYEDTLIKVGKYVRPDLPYKNGIFAWMFGKNDTDDGEYTVFTGEDGLGNLNIINNYNGRQKLSFWKDDSCNLINGSNGEVSPPLKDDQQELTFFQSFICRSMTFSFTEDVSHLGLKGKRFSINKSVFGNETVNPDNACFDTRPDLPSGVQDLSACQYGAPVILSSPHFYLADPLYLQLMEGVEPNESLHMSYLDVMSDVGFGMETAIRVQINLFLRQDKAMPQFSRVTEGVYPIFWMEIIVKLTPEFANYILGMMQNPKTIAYSVIGVMMGLAVILMISGVIITLISISAAKNVCEDDPLLGANSEAVKRYSAVSTEKSPNKETSSKSQTSNDAWVRQETLHASQSNDQAVLSNGSINQNSETYDVPLLDS